MCALGPEVVEKWLPLVVQGWMPEAAYIRDFEGLCFNGDSI